MFGRVRCFCGRYMKRVEYEYATHVSGGRAGYKCSRCGARANIWSQHGTDDMPVGGFIFTRGREVELDWRDDAEEWAPV
jgi:hypothetical protein